MERDREREQEGIIKTVCKENNINTIENEKAVKPHTRIRTNTERFSKRESVCVRERERERPRGRLHRGRLAHPAVSVSVSSAASPQDY